MKSHLKAWFQPNYSTELLIKFRTRQILPKINHQTPKRHPNGFIVHKNQNLRTQITKQKRRRLNNLERLESLKSRKRIKILWMRKNAKNVKILSLPKKHSPLFSGQFSSLVATSSNFRACIIRIQCTSNFTSIPQYKHAVINHRDL